MVINTHTVAASASLYEIGYQISTPPAPQILQDPSHLLYLLFPLKNRPPLKLVPLEIPMMHFASCDAPSPL